MHTREKSLVEKMEERKADSDIMGQQDSLLALNFVWPIN
jgi:hypothetical protein